MDLLCINEKFYAEHLFWLEIANPPISHTLCIQFVCCSVFGCGRSLFVCARILMQFLFFFQFFSNINSCSYFLHVKIMNTPNPPKINILIYILNVQMKGGVREMSSSRLLMLLIVQ